MTRAVALLAAVLAAGLGGCRDGAKATARATPATSAAPRAEGSLYTLPVTLTDQDGGKYGLDAFRGNPVFLGMFSGRCEGECPIITTIKTALSMLDDPAAAEMRVLLVSFDAGHDTPAALHAIVGERGLDRRWKLASAPDEQARELAAALGVHYRRLPDGTFSHESTVILLDRTGGVDARLDDASQPIDALVQHASAIVAAR